LPTRDEAPWPKNDFTNVQKYTTLRATTYRSLAIRIYKSVVSHFGIPPALRAPAASTFKSPAQKRTEIARLVGQ
jgi:hypothetical protein